ncbi:MAG: Pyruvate synthase [Candidatus Anoxychlamydiales bacterium]|nr:Pyruvate synthase [Candidatus Anoxychlamydiales bacterium]
MNKKFKSMDGNNAAAHIAYALSEVCAIYPITPSSTMAEIVDDLASKEKKNLLGSVVDVIEMQSEAGAAGAVHGILSSGALASTFTSSQGLLLMIPNMYKMAGELLPCVMHVAARSLAGEALSIFGDHQDVMATRASGFAMLCSTSVQEAMDLALVSHLSAIDSSLPFMHFFDGFRTSHEIQKVEVIDYEDIKKIVDFNKIDEFRKRALNPSHPYVKGTAQNPDIYFQEMEAVNKFYLDLPSIVEKNMQKVFEITNRKYNLFDYYGDKDATRVIIAMGSSVDTIEETIDYLNAKGEKVGLVKIRLYRPFSLKHFLDTVPKTAKKIAVLDRTKESGSLGEPLYLDVCSSFMEAKDQRVIVGGRYGLGSKEFTPSMVKAIYDNLALENPKNHFTIGINDDITHTSLDVKENISFSRKDEKDCMFWGIGGDGTVGANKEAIKIIGDNTNRHVQGYFAYDSKKTSGLTMSFLRFSSDIIKSRYLIEQADYIACHTIAYLKKYDLVKNIKENGIFVLNSPYSLEEMEKKLPNAMKRKIAKNNVKFFNIDATKLAEEIGVYPHINIIMQTVFFKLINILDIEKAKELLKEAIKKTYEDKGEDVVNKNISAVDKALDNLKEIKYPTSWKDLEDEEIEVDMNKPEFVKKIADILNAQEGDILPVSAFKPGGIFPLGTAKYEKRGLSKYVSSWIKEKCIQCNQCAFVCPHACIRSFLLTKEEVDNAPEGLEVIQAIGKDKEYFFCIAISPYDCTGCTNCVNVCPAKGKALKMTIFENVYQKNAKVWDYLVSLDQRDSSMSKFTLKGSQFKTPLIEFSGACAGCGETPYIKLVTQMFGERMIIANATGCTSIYGGSAPSFPYTTTKKGYGPAWANSLFEDNAEFGFGIYLGENHRREKLKELVTLTINENISNELKEEFKKWVDSFEDGEINQNITPKIIQLLEKEKPSNLIDEIKKSLDVFTKSSTWLIGGDGWAYDIGYGGLDHVLAMNRDVNILVLDTELYSNTGGQTSKATPIGAVAKFASGGKKTIKKDLALLAMTYGNVYVASVCMGADKNQLARALKEAESYRGPSLIIAFSSCIGHGLKKGLAAAQEQQKQAVDSGYWFNYRYDPRLKLEDKNPFVLDSKEPSMNIEDFLLTQRRFSVLQKKNPKLAKELFDKMHKQREEKYKLLKKMSEEKFL